MRPANPQLTRDRARLAAGLRSNNSRPKLRTTPRPGRSLPKSFTSPSVKRVTPWRSSARHSAKRANNSREIRRRGGAGQHFGQGRGVAQPEVEALPGHRVQRLRGIADEHDAPGDRIRGARQHQRIRVALADSRKAADAPAESAEQLRREGRFIERHEFRGARGAHRPDHCVAAAGDRQHGQRTGGCESLEGIARIGPVGRGVHDDGDLLVVFDVRVDAGAGAQHRAGTIGGDRHRRANAGVIAAAGQFEQHRVITQRRGPDLRGNGERHVGRLAQGLPQDAADGAIRHHVAEGGNPLLGGIQARHAESTGIRNVDGANRRRLGCHRRPHAQALENLARAVAQRGGALIETGLRRRIRRHTFDEQGAQFRVAQCQREAGTDHAAADDCDIVSIMDWLSRESHHATDAMSLSMATASFGTPSVSTSQPSRVTTTSSSMRMPMP